jgi:hypothetical protein
VEELLFPPVQENKPNGAVSFSDFQCGSTNFCSGDRKVLMSRKVARTTAERERGVRQQLEEEEEPI